MAKNSTHISYESFISHEEKNMKGKDTLDEAIIQNILSFSKALKIKKSNKIGPIEFILN